MSQLIHDPIDIHVEPRVRAIIRAGAGRNEPTEVADIQIVIHALAHHCRKLQQKNHELGLIIERQREKLREYETAKGESDE